MRPPASQVQRIDLPRARRSRTQGARVDRQRPQHRRREIRHACISGATRVNGDWHYRLREHKGTLLALGAFVAMFTIYAANHTAGLNANVATTAANKGVLLAIVPMAQTLVVLTSGIDLSVGMVMV